MEVGGVTTRPLCRLQKHGDPWAASVRSRRIFIYYALLNLPVNQPVGRSLTAVNTNLVDRLNKPVELTGGFNTRMHILYFAIFYKFTYLFLALLYFILFDSNILYFNMLPNDTLLK